MEPRTSPSEIPLVSVIIPTLGRPELVQRAIRSALAQTHPRMEIVVVSDGPDPATAETLRHRDPRVIYLQLPQRSGPAAARAAGLQASSGAWINLLDDDDELLPTKIEAQLVVADSTNPKIMIACRCIFRQQESEHRDNVWPARPMRPDEDLGDYLLLRPGLRGRPGLINLHCLLISRALALAVPMPDSPDHEDWSWLLALWHQGQARIQFLWEPLAVYHLSSTELTRSRRFNWRESLDWAEAHRAWITPAAFNSFLASKVALKARRAGSWKGLLQVIRSVFDNHPSLIDLIFLAAITATPMAMTNWAWKRSLRSNSSNP